MTFLLMVEQLYAASTYGWQPGQFTRWLWRRYCPLPIDRLTYYLSLWQKESGL